MKGHRLELADIFRTHQKQFLARWSRVLSRQQRKALRDIRDCRTAALGGNLQQCDRCGHRVILYNSCRNRHCPKCQAMARAHWLQQRDEVQRVIHPALPDYPGHAIWKRDFAGSSGLFSIVLNAASDAAVAAMLDGLELFGMGYSWGGFESLIAPLDPKRTAVRWSEPAPGIRIHVGLEDVDDLIADLDKGLARFRKALASS